MNGDPMTTMNGKPEVKMASSNRRSGAAHHNWKGGRYVSEGYLMVMAKGHPRASLSGYIAEHILIAEKALGRYLDQCHPVHHHDENTLNNSNGNLVICEDNAYHRLLHQRLRVLRAGGIPGQDKICSCCRKVKQTGEFSPSQKRGDGRNTVCKNCVAAKAKLRWEARRNEH